MHARSIGRRNEHILCLRFFCRTAISLIGLFILVSTESQADPWPTFRHDIARSGISAERLEFPLRECWVFASRHAPQPAWSDPKPGPVEDILELRRVHFDDVFQVVGGDGLLWFGSSADNKLYCLDLASGSVRWSRITGGPIRLAPTLSAGQLYFGSDDGWIYCLSAGNGNEVWKFHAAPDPRRLLGHGKLISLWPSRTGVLVDGGTAYFGAGIFPAEGVFLYAVDARDGKLVWRNDTTGENPQSRVSPQGYLLASDAAIYSPMGRVPPAAFRRTDGVLLYETSFGKQVGGSYALLAGKHVYTGTEELVAFDRETRDRFAAFPGRRLVVADDRFYLATGTHLVAIDRATRKEVWKTPSACADELILAADVLVAGGKDRVSAVEAKTGKTCWEATVAGSAKGLSVVDGRLVASTDQGRIYCFGPASAPQRGTVAEGVAENPFATSPLSPLFQRTAETVLRHSGVRRGYCLLLGCETGQLAYELAKRTELMVYAVSPDAEKVESARRALDSAGVYGARVCVEQWPLTSIPYADCFANLIVSETAAATGQWPGGLREAVRMLKPLGGTLMIGQPDRPAASGSRPDSRMSEWLAAPELAGAQQIQDGGSWLKFVRGAIPGAGSWTHQYANPGNTACSDDEAVRCPLGLLWFGRPGPGDMLNRHTRAASPLALDGRLFVQGENVVMAYDIYNGLRLWERRIPGAERPNASHDSSNFAINEHGLFVGVGANCLRLAPATGETLTTYPMPPPAAGTSRWGHVALVGDRLFGTRAAAAGISDALIVFDIRSGQPVWRYESNRIHHTAIAIGHDRVFLVTDAVTREQRLSVLEPQQQRLASLSAEQKKEAALALEKAFVRLVVALDANTGKPLWQKPMDLTHCGDNIACMYHDGVLVLFGVYLDGHYWKEFFAGQFASRTVVALAAEDGKELWSKPAGYRVRPLIVGDTLHTEPWAFDLKTGAPKTRVNRITEEQENWQFARPGHHCGCPSASPNCLFFRSLTLGYYDLLGDYGTMHFGGQRPGCWINSIAAGGVLLMPEASTGCMCTFPNMGTVVFQPRQEQKAWAYYSTVGPLTPVKHLAVNFGAAGDRQDGSGLLWLAYPRPTGSLVLNFPVETSFYPGGSYVKQNSVYVSAQGTDSRWLFASAAAGLQKCSIPLLAPGDGKAQYRVRLAFLDSENELPGKRVFDIRLQGNLVAKEYDVVRAAQGKGRAVFAEYSGIGVDEKLIVEFGTKSGATSLASLPSLYGIEVTRERFIGLGFQIPDLVLNNARPQQTASLRLANLCDQPFRGTLQIAAPSGVSVTPQEQAVELTVGTRREIPVAFAVSPGTSPSRSDIPVKLVRSDGSLELARSIRVEHLGPRSRVAFPAVEDTCVVRRYGNRNFGTATMMQVDGGDQQMNDHLHTVALLKFRVHIPGKPVRATLRIVNAGNPAGDAGRICLVEQPWQETRVTYDNRPAAGRELAKLGRVQENEIVERTVPVGCLHEGEFSLMLDATSADGVDFLTRESGSPAELVVEYED